MRSITCAASIIMLFFMVMTTSNAGSDASESCPTKLNDIENSAHSGRQIIATLKDSQFLAPCQGVGDDSESINKTLKEARRALRPAGDLGWQIGQIAKFSIRGAQCLIRSTIDMTGFYGSGFVADFRGSVISCETDKMPCLDMTGSGQVQLLGLNIIGSSDHSPNIGLALGRRTNDGVGADHNYIDSPTIVGSFELTPFFNNQSETTLINKATFVNSAANAFGAIWDGSNHFNFQSKFTGTKYPRDQPLSFNENTCIECNISTLGSGSIPIWLGGTARHKFVNSFVAYSAAQSAPPEPAVELYFGSRVSNDFLDLDIHFEDNGGFHNMVNLVRFSGSKHVVVHGLAMRDNYPEQSGPLFSRGAGAVSVEIQDAELHFGTLAGLSPSWWDNQAFYTISGRIYSADGTYSAPGRLSGIACVKAKCEFTP